MAGMEEAVEAVGEAQGGVHPLLMVETAAAAGVRSLRWTGLGAGVGPAVGLSCKQPGSGTAESGGHGV